MCVCVCFYFRTVKNGSAFLTEPPRCIATKLPIVALTSPSLSVLATHCNKISPSPACLNTSQKNGFQYMQNVATDIFFFPPSSSSKHRSASVSDTHLFLRPKDETLHEEQLDSRSERTPGSQRQFILHVLVIGSVILNLPYTVKHCA